MANEKETLTDIATWLRVDFHEICPWWVDGGDCAGCPLGGNGKNCIFDKIADRVDAAAERERTEIEADALAVGGIVEAARKGELSKTRPKNAADFGQFGNAAMREALRLIKQMGIDLRNMVSLLDRKDGRRELCLKTSIEIYQTAERALFEPPRNCDLFATVKDAAIEFSKLRNNPHPCPDFIFSEWLLAPATKGGAA